MKRYLLLTVFLSFVLGWLALRFNPSQSFTEGLVGQPVDLIPGQGGDNLVDETLERLLYRPLFTYNGEGKIVKDLVADYRVSKGGLVYNVEIGDFYWRDGKPITSTDVISTFIQDPSFADIRIEQEGEKKIRFILQNPLSSFLNVLTAPIAPAHFRNLSVNELGSSQLFIKDLRREGGKISQLTMVNEGEGDLKELNFRFYASEGDLTAAAGRGEINAFSNGAEFSDESFASYQMPVFSRYFAIFFNLSNGNLLARNRNFRLAARTVTPQLAGLKVEGPFSGTWAQQRWATPKFKGGKFKGEIELAVVDEPEFRSLARQIEQIWEKKLGVKVTLRFLPANSLESVLEAREFAALLLGQEVNRDPDRYNLWHSSQREYPGQNISGWANPRADRALEEARKTSNQKSRLTHYRNFQRLFGEDNPAIFLYHPAFNYYLSKNFMGIDLSKAFGPSERFWNFSQWGRAFSF